MNEALTAHPDACIRKPTLQEAPAIHALIETAAHLGEVLPRRVDEVAEGIRDFHVFAGDDGILGCCAAHVDTARLAEIRSLVVHPDARGRGIGHALVLACIEEARDIGIPHVYALTRKTSFFEQLGFYITSMERLPQKVFKDCERCPRYHACDETAVMLDLPLIETPVPVEA
jgi:amino-acid N-acetyltransferase